MNCRCFGTTSVLLLCGFVWANAGLADAALADDAGNSLRKLVGDDVGLCVEVTQLKDRLPQLRASRFLERFRSTRVYRQWLQGRDYQKLNAARVTVEKLSKKPFETFANELFGQAVVLAVYPVADGKPAGVLLTRAASDNDLDFALATWNRAEQRQPVELKHDGRSYFRRGKIAEGQQPDAGQRSKHRQFYFRQGATLALSDSETLIRRVIDLTVAAEANEKSRCLLNSQNYQRAIKSLSQANFATVYFNPRAWDGEVLKQSNARTPPPVRALWERCESLVGGVSMRQALVVEAVLLYDNTNAAAGWTDFVKKAAGFPLFLERVPPTALLSFAGRVDVSRVETLITSNTLENKQKELKRFRQVGQGLLLGQDLLRDVLPKLQVNWGAYVVRREKLATHAAPVDGLFAIELPDGDGDGDGDGAEADGQQVSLRAALDNGLNTGLNLLAAFHNGKAPQQAARVRIERQKDALMRWVDSYGPYQPAYAITSKYLVMASSPQLVREFNSRSADASLAKSPEFRTWATTYFPAANQIVIFNAAETRGFLERNRQFFVDQATTNRKLSAEEATQRMQRFDDILQLLDATFVAAQIGSDRIRIAAGAAVLPKSAAKADSKTD